VVAGLAAASLNAAVWLGLAAARLCVSGTCNLFPRCACRDYLLSLTGDAALRMLGSPGKSGSVFFLSDDDRWVGGAPPLAAAGCLFGFWRAGLLAH
jgi:hypothetical protein